MLSLISLLALAAGLLGHRPRPLPADKGALCPVGTRAYGAETPGAFVDMYYELSPPLTDFVSTHEMLRTLVREAALDPIVAVLTATEELWND